MTSSRTAPAGFCCRERGGGGGDMIWGFYLLSEVWESSCPACTGGLDSIQHWLSCLQIPMLVFRAVGKPHFSPSECSSLLSKHKLPADTDFCPWPWSGTGWPPRRWGESHPQLARGGSLEGAQRRWHWWQEGRVWWYTKIFFCVHMAFSIIVNNTLNKEPISLTISLLSSMQHGKH